MKEKDKKKEPAEQAPEPDLPEVSKTEEWEAALAKMEVDVRPKAVGNSW